MSNFANPEQDLYSRKLILPSGTASEPTLIFANDPTKGFYFDVDAGLIKAVGFDGGGGGGGATTALDNLASVAINASLIFDTDSIYSVGASNFRASTVYTTTVSTGIGGSLNLSAANLLLDFEQVSGGGNLRLYNNSNTSHIDIDSSDEVNIYADSLCQIFARSENSGAFDHSVVSGNTRMLLWDVDSGALQRVSVGVADSGGVGFKVLRIPN